MLLCICVGLFSQCVTGENKEPIEYKGPVSEAENVELYYTENEKVKVKMLADVLYEFKNGDREFPKGVYIEFFGPDGATITSTLKADHAYYFKTEDRWRGRRNVEVKNLAKKEQLNTEELFWRPRDRKIFTDKFVTIRMEGDVLYGQGLTANEDLTNYVIQKPYGDMDVKEE